LPRKAEGLTAAKVRTAKPGRYGDGGGLYLLVRGLQARFWLFRYTSDGKMREMGLGPASGPSVVSLADARLKARRLHDMVREGFDPLLEREVEREAKAVQAKMAEIKLVTFRDAADRYIAAHESSWRNAKHRQQWRNTLDTYGHPILGDLPVADVDTDAVMRVLEPIWREKVETASRLRGRIETVLEYAKARGWREGENPARWRGHVANMLPTRTKVQPVEHHAALPWREIGDFMAALANQEGLGALALRLTILTAARTSEAIEARWSEIDMSAGVWTVPPSRMKAAKEHRVPLSDAAQAVLTTVAPLRDDALGGWIFPGARAGRPLSNMVFLMLLRRMERGDLTAHGFRSTFRDWAAETGQPADVAEAALAHTLGNKVQAAYQRGDLLERRRNLMVGWADFCERSKTVGNAVPLPGAEMLDLARQSP
jgi:integrase